MRKPNKDEIKVIRAIAKKHGIKGCRMSLRTVQVGKQCERIEKSVAESFLMELNEHGFDTSDIFKESITLDVCDTFLVHTV